MPVINLDPPVGGINAFDSPENMAPTDAIALDNWIPRSGYLESRPPWEVCSDLTAGFIGTLVTYHDEDGTEKLIAHRPSNDTFYDVSTGTSSAFSGTFGGGSTTRWQHMEINGVLVLVCGEDNELAFNGTTFTDLNYTGSSPAITPGEFVNCVNFKGRAIYTKDGVNSFWYAEAGSYQGSLTEFPLDSVAKKGGYPVVVESWSMDTGTGPDDVLILVQNTGEVLMYQGDDPGDADNWEIASIYEIPAPAGPRGVVKHGADLIIITEGGFVNMVDVLKADQATDIPAFSRRIWPMISDISAQTGGGATSGIGGNGCNAVAWNGLILFGLTETQSGLGADPVYLYVINVQTGAWCRFTSIGNDNIGQMAIFNGDLIAPYEETSTVTIRKLSTYATASEAITCSAIPAFTDLGVPNRKKHLTAVQFATNIPSPGLIQATGYSDFNLEGSLPSVTAYAGGSPPSESGVGTFPKMRKAMAHTIFRGWENVNAYGFNVSMAVQMATNDRTLYWRQSAYRFKLGGAH